jgi:alpha-glucosidase (family GH31 glycosyl hydrolase)
VKPHFYDYPEDDETFNNPDHTYMLGDSIKVSPVLKQGLRDGDTFEVYFPKGKWYDLTNMKTIVDTTAQNGAYVKLNASNTSTNIHLKAGKIIPFQKNTQSYKTTTDFQTKLKTSFVIARDAAKSYAEGYVLIDDGISADSYAILDDNKQKFTYWKLRYAGKSINFWV